VSYFLVPKDVLGYLPSCRQVFLGDFTQFLDDSNFQADMLLFSLIVFLDGFPHLVGVKETNHGDGNQHY
jgi:hypothetical protein